MRKVSIALVTLTIVAACSLDWDRLDPKLGGSGGGVGEGGAGASVGGGGGLGGSAGGGGVLGGGGTGGALPESGEVLCSWYTDGWFRTASAYPDGGLVVGGSFENTLTLGGDPLVSAGADDGLVARFDANCQHVFSVRVGSPQQYDGVEGVAIAPDGGVVITGAFQGTADYGTFSATSSGDQDAYVAKLDDDGTFLWATSFGGTAGDWGRAVAVDESGDVYVAATFSATIILGADVFTSNGSSDGVIVKLDGSTGNVIWATGYGSTASERARSLAIGADGMLRVAGRHGGPMQVGGIAVPHAGTRDAYLLQLDLAGDPVWVEAFASPDPMSIEYAQGLALRPNDAIVTVGRFDTTLDVGGTTLTSAGERDIFLMELDPGGSPSWARSLGGSGVDRVCDVALDADGNIGLAGAFEGLVDLGAGDVGTAGSTSLFGAVYDPTGELQWARVFPVAAEDYTRALSVAFANDGDLIVAGTANGVVDFDGSAAPNPGFLLRLSK